MAITISRTFFWFHHRQRNHQPFWRCAITHSTATNHAEKIVVEPLDIRHRTQQDGTAQDRTASTPSAATATSITSDIGIPVPTESTILLYFIPQYSVTNIQYSSMMLARTFVARSSCNVSASTGFRHRFFAAGGSQLGAGATPSIGRWMSSVTDTTDEGSGDGDKATPEITTAEDTTTTAAPPSKESIDKISSDLRPSEVVTELNRHIVGQNDAKRAVAIAMRNRWRRRQLPQYLRKEVTPRNVLLVGPTGCGKTEVARRMAMMNDAPFIKVEATKFTEVGYHGRDVDSIIRDLMDSAMKLVKERHNKENREQAKKLVEERILDILSGPSSGSAARGRESFRDMLQQGLLDDQEIEIDVPNREKNPNEYDAGNNPQAAMMADIMQKLTSGGKKQSSERKKLPISEAREIIMEMELERLVENVDLRKSAVTAVEQTGIVFIDEIDKICSSREGFSSRSADASAEGVQRDLLPLVEGTTINTKHGNINTDYILFIASGSFHSVKVSDMLPELQGRLPIRVELAGLTEDDLYRILTEPVANLVHQQVELIGAEGVKLEFEDDAVREIARMAAQLNKTVENIGARRLHTVMERIMENISFEAAEMEEDVVMTVTKELVAERLKDVTMKADVSRYIL